MRLLGGIELNSTIQYCIGMNVTIDEYLLCYISFSLPNDFFLHLTFLSHFLILFPAAVHFP